MKSDIQGLRLIKNKYDEVSTFGLVCDAVSVEKNIYSHIFPS